VLGPFLGTGEYGGLQAFNKISSCLTYPITEKLIKLKFYTCFASALLVLSFFTFWPEMLNLLCKMLCVHSLHFSESIAKQEPRGENWDNWEEKNWGSVSSYAFLSFIDMENKSFLQCARVCVCVCVLHTNSSFHWNLKCGPRLLWHKAFDLGRFSYTQLLFSLLHCFLHFFLLWGAVNLVIVRGLPSWQRDVYRACSKKIKINKYIDAKLDKDLNCSQPKY